MKKIIPIIIIILITCGVGVYIGFNLPQDNKKDDEKTNKFTIHNVRILDDDYDFDYDEDDGYEILDIIDNEEDYEDFIDSYKYSSYQPQDDFKEYNKKYKYVMVVFNLDSCTETIKAKKYSINKDTLTLNLVVESTCGLCAPEPFLYEFAIPKDEDFDDVKLKLTYKQEEDCPNDVAYKPVLYLYPEKEQNVNVTFTHPDLLTTTYPKYKNGWTVTAKPNGDLTLDGKYYYGLYWEENTYNEVDFHEGFYVTKDNAIDFLEEKLTTIGLNDRERNEFIMYWLPILEKNGQNLVYFELTEELQNSNSLNITPTPDSLLRLRIHVKKVDNKVDIKEQILPAFERNGFTAVEWGGVVH